jgi:hypothetical protein
MRFWLCLIGWVFVFGAPVASRATPSLPDEPENGALKVAFTFHDGGDCQLALTPDSIGLLAWDSSAGGLEPDDEGDGLEHAMGKRALSQAERDTAAVLLGLTRSFKGQKRYACERPDGYGFSLWSDSLTLHCRNCFSCTEGVGIQEARTLARFGRISLWLYRLRSGLAGAEAVR